MKLNMKGTEKEFRFDKVGFVRRLDEVYKAEKEGVEFGFGLMFADMHLEQFSIPQLSQILRCASTDRRLTVTDIDEAIEELADNSVDDVEALFDNVKEEMGKSGVIQATRRKLEKLEQQAKKQNKK